MSEYSYTAEQSAVIQHDLNDHAKVIAVAGAGKSTTLIGRIQHLLEQGVAAEKIGVFMFNKSAQEEFSARLSKAMSQVGTARIPNVMTFHAFGMRLARRLEQRHLLPTAKLVTDEFSMIKLIREARHRLMRQNLEVELHDERDWLEDFLLFIDQVKAASISAADVFEAGNWSKECRHFVALYEQLESLRKQSNLRFFADLLADPFALIQQSNSEQLNVIQTLAPDYQYLLIDEFQDTNPCQYELLKALYQQSARWMIVGDVQQCIYEWRGAAPEIMAEQFDQDFVAVSTYPLACSFRFGHSIGMMATCVVSQNQTEQLVIGQGGQTEVDFARSNLPGRALLSELKTWHEQGGSLENCAVLVRLYSDMVPVQLALMHKGVPYQLHGDSPLLENRQIRMLMAYLSVMAGGLNDTSLFYDKTDVEYLVTVPNVTNASADRTRLLTQARQSPHMIPELLERMAEQTEGWKAKKIADRADWLRSLTMYKNDPAQGLLQTLDKLGIYRYFEHTSSRDIQTQEKIATCEAFLSYVRGMASDAGAIIAQLVKLNEQDQQHTHGVHLMTIHKSKGLEFDLVMMSGLQEGRFPYYDDDLSSIDRQAAAEMQAERRLFYVAMTRARKRLVFLESPAGEDVRRLSKGGLLAGAARSGSMSRFVYEAQPVPIQKMGHHWDDKAPLELTADLDEPLQKYLAELGDDAPNVTFKQTDTAVKGELKAGDKVRHEQYGQGIVVRQETTGKRMIFVDFAEEGLKRFNPKHTRLVRLANRNNEA
ncbi:DNA helicase II [Marinomonas aquimarina]|uniref:DNA 3'-5' helicase n=1 Tax=Marinomonas aquimarina TaxID=295068 RepID=A0A1A8T4P2_9GAMM|nr:ATP-dependent helicase [Marinomonas aquimarina]SBS27213.1 DNA helicase II [Marinomonas aquimarina]